MRELPGEAESGPRKCSLFYLPRGEGPVSRESKGTCNDWGVEVWSQAPVCKASHHCVWVVWSQAGYSASWSLSSQFSQHGYTWPMSYDECWHCSQLRSGRTLGVMWRYTQSLPIPWSMTSDGFWVRILVHFRAQLPGVHKTFFLFLSINGFLLPFLFFLYFLFFFTSLHSFLFSSLSFNWNIIAI